MLNNRDEEAKAVLRRPELAADLLVGAAIVNAGGRTEVLDEHLVNLADGLKRAVAGGAEARRLENEVRSLLGHGGMLTREPAQCVRRAAIAPIGLSRFGSPPIPPPRRPP